MPNVLLFLLILPNAGGEGKTTLAYFIRAIFELAGLEDYSLDADQGNLALTNKLGERVDNDRPGWETRPEVAYRIVAKANRRPVSMDSGANMPVAFSSIGNLVPELQRRFKAAGYRTAVLVALTPNKSGGAGGSANCWTRSTGRRSSSCSITEIVQNLSVKCARTCRRCRFNTWHQGYKLC